MPGTPMGSTVFSPSINLVDSVIDEIALEGLDGITLEALWKRLSIRFQTNEEFSESFKMQVWNICLSTKQISFYKLNSPRPPLIIYDRYQYIDPDFGTILEPDNVPEDIYDHCPIDDTKNNLRGSCKDYYTRELLNTKNLTFELAENDLQNRLVIVASQKMREEALLGDNACPTIELGTIPYCFLERIGRSRYHGEITQGKRSLNIMKEDPKTLFYHRKFLLKHKLITKQMHHQKNSGHSTSGCLLHLPRFYVERKPKGLYLAERIIEILKKKENYIADYEEIKKELQLENSLKKLFRTIFFQKVARSDLLVPYRTLYPDATPLEYQTKNNTNKEKKLRAVQLLDPNIDIVDLLDKDDFVDEEEVYELDSSNQLINIPFLNQANKIVEETYDRGLIQRELTIKMGLTKLHSRTILRSLDKLQLVSRFYNDIGRQRATNFVSSKFVKNSDISKQFYNEIDRMKEFVKTASNLSQNEESDLQKSESKNDSNDSVAVKMEVNKDADEPMDVDLDENYVDDVENTADDKEPESVECNSTNREQLFSVVNKIKKKYKARKCGMKYKVTYNKINEMQNIDDKLKRLAQPKLDNPPPKKRIKLMSATIRKELENCEVEIEEINMATDGSNGGLKSLKKELENEELCKNSNSVSYRVLKRANMILKAVEQHLVIEDTIKLMKMINEEEEREGYDVKIDRKSLMRILQRLAIDKLVKNIKLNMKSNDRTKSLMFICDPKININHTIIQSVIEQTKLKFCLSKKRDTPKPVVTKKSKKSTKTIKDVNVKTLDVIYDPKAGKEYGYSPKFIRMQILHLLLFYIIYDHPGSSTLSKSEHIENLRLRGYEINEDMENEINEIYSSEVDWKMFIPPLPEHFNWPKGWSLMSDILLRIPLSIFLKIYKIPFIIPNFEVYINHPIRKHYLIKDLPSELRNTLLMKRKYIFSIHESITRLCFIGLVQFGPQKLKEKDQVFIYLNKSSELIDTTLSTVNNYNTIEDREYIVHNYYFDKIQSVEKYWYDMWQICVNTQLGARPPQGTEVIVEYLMKKPEMVQTLKARTAEEAPKLDLGLMPGDRKGAAGLDSAFFSHLKRNWNWDSFSSSYNMNSDRKRVVNTQRNNNLSNIHPKPIKFSELEDLKRTSGPKTVSVKELKANDRKKIRKPAAVKSIEKLGSNENDTTDKQNRRVRKILPKKSKPKRRVKYDDIDCSALQNMDKLRVDWDPREDNILLVCKVVMMYLCPNPRSQLINFTAVRDVLRSYSLTSHNKTSCACQRRLVYMFKKPQTVHSVALGVEEIKQNYYINKRYGDIINKIKQTTNSSEQDEKISTAFKDLVAYVANKYYDIAQCETKETIKKLNTLQEFHLIYEINHLKKPKCNQDFHNDIKNVNDIHIATINSVIYSSMCCGKDRKSWAYQLFKIYERYPENLLRSTMSKIRADHMVSVKKNYVTAMKKYRNSLPMSSSQYQLSTTWTYKFQTKIPCEIYAEINDFIIKILNEYEKGLSTPQNGVQIIPPTGGMVIAIQEFLAFNKIDFNIKLPDQVIILDPAIHEYDEHYVKIAKRYKDILSNSVKSNKKSNEKDQDESTEKLVEIKETQSNLNLDKVSSDKPEMEVNKKADKKSSKKENMSWGLSKFNFPKEEFNEEYALESDESDDEEDFIKFLDGTVIPINNEDLNYAKTKTIDDEIHKAFSATRPNEINDILESSALNRLKEIDENVDLTIKRKEKRRKEEVNKSNVIKEIRPKKVIEKTNSNFVNDIIKAIKTNEYKDCVSNREEDNNDPQRRFTRLALLNMGEESNETLLDSHHAHEFFLINSFDVFYSLNDLNDKENVVFDNNHRKNILMLPDHIYHKVVNDLNKFATFPKEPLDYNSIKNSLISNNYMIEEEINLIYEYIREKREIGVTLKELNDKFYKTFRNKLYDIIDCLVNQRLLLKSGVTQAHYIHHYFLDPWLIKSIKISRLQRESMQPLPRGCVYNFKTTDNDKIKDEVIDKNDEGNPLDVSSDTSIIKNIEETNTTDKNEENNSTSPKSIRKNRTCLLQTKDIYTAAKKLDLSSAENLNVVIRPWIQIDGVINKSILEKMLGAILAHCIINPGIILSQLQNRFVPALQPYHTRELVEILLKLECLELKILCKPATTFFSPPTSAELYYPIKDDGTTEFDDEMVIEVMTGATLKLGAFFHR